MYGGYGSTSPPLTNNPFLPNTVQSTSSRYPDISTLNGNGSNGNLNGFGGSWSNGSPSPMMNGGGGYAQQQQGMYQPQQPMQTGWGGSGQMSLGGGYGGQSPTPSGPGYTSPPPMSMGGGMGMGGSGFQPQSAFGQQLANAAPHVSGSSYGYLGGQQSPVGAGFPQQQQQLQQQQLLSQFDPYSALGQGWDPNGNNSNSNNNVQAASNGMQPAMSTGSSYSTSSGSSSSAGTSSSSAGYGTGPRGDLHPRDHIRAHKQELEAWDAYAWKQLIGSFEALKSAWESRKLELTARAKELIAHGNMGVSYGPYYGQQLQQEAMRLQGLLKEAEGNFDSIAASIYQIQEVFQNYRQSGDHASKRRVREAINAALQGLPGWPQAY